MPTTYNYNNALTNNAYYSDPENFGSYQFVTLTDIIDNFMATYTGADKVFGVTQRADVNFHAHRALQELSFDTFKSIKTQEVEVPPSLALPLPHDYVNYVKFVRVDNEGIEHVLYPMRKTSNPLAIEQAKADSTTENEGDYAFDTTDIDEDGVTTELKRQYTEDPESVTSAISNTSTNITLSVTNSNIKPGWRISGGLSAGIPANTYVKSINGTAVTMTNAATATNGTISLTFTSPLPGSDTWDKFSTGTWTGRNNKYDLGLYKDHMGRRFGIDPQYAQNNGSYFIDDREGRVFFGSNLSGKTVIIKYISDSLGTAEELQVHKFAEEAMYQSIAYALSLYKAGMEAQIGIYKQSKFASTRRAKIRLSNIKLEEITQIFRGKAKHIKH